MTYESLTHVALRTEALRAAEAFYCQLFGLEVAFREAEAKERWWTLPSGKGWQDAEAAGIQLGMVALRRDGFVLALEAAPQVDRPGPLSHIGVLVDQGELDELRARAADLECAIVLDRPGLMIIDDGYGVRWELTTFEELRSSGAATGRWLDLQGS